MQGRSFIAVEYKVGNNIKESWQIIKSFTQLASSFQNEIKVINYCKGNVIESKRDIAETFNGYFVNIPDSLLLQFYY